MQKDVKGGLGSLELPLYREANQCANWMAIESLNNEFGPKTFNLPSKGIMPITSVFNNI